MVWGVVLLLWATAALGDAAREAETLYGQGDYGGALEAYEQEELQETGAARWFNQANCHYRLGQYEEAAGLYRRAAVSDDERLAARSQFNLGNTLHQQALAAQQEPQKALELLDQAARSYRRARDDEGALPGARNNLALSRELMQQIIEQMQEQEQEQQQQQQDDQQKEDEEEKCEQEQSQSQDQQQQEQEDEQQESEQEKQEQEQQQQEGDKQEEQEQQQAQQEPSEEEPSDEVTQAAEEILEEEQQRREQQRIRAVGVVPVERDW